MSIRFQKLTQSQIKQLKDAVSNILHTYSNDGYQHIQTLYLLNTSDDILIQKLKERNIILEQMSNMAIALLEQLERKNMEHDLLNEQLQSLRSKSQKKHFQFYDLKEDNQNLKRLNQQLAFTVSNLEREKQTHTYEYQRLNLTYQMEKVNAKVHIEKLQAQIEVLSELNIQKLEKEYIKQFVKMKEEIYQLTIHNENLRKKLLSTELELNKIYEELRCSKQFIANSAQNTKSTVHKNQQPFQEMVNDQSRFEQVRSSLKLQLGEESAQYLKKPQLLAHKIEDIQDNDVSQFDKDYSYHYVESQLSQVKMTEPEQQPQNKKKCEDEENEKILQTSIILQEKEINQDSKTNLALKNIKSFNKKHQALLEQFAANSKPTITSRKKVDLTMLKDKKISRIQYLLTIFGEQKDKEPREPAPKPRQPFKAGLKKSETKIKSDKKVQSKISLPESRNLFTSSSSSSLSRVGSKSNLNQF